ncbi:hypothetical protein HYT01_03360 [Candidatus Giovannonibacteria bacterium]|nr:hypothetical protein [Candidatus Giovannonibacteria bacterium]
MKYISFFAVFVLVAVLNGGYASAYVQSPRADSINLRIEKGDMISQICADLFKKHLLPPKIGTVKKCVSAVLRKNFGADNETTREQARFIVPGNELFFPFVPRSEYDKRFTERIKQLSKKNSETSTQLAETEKNFSRLMMKYELSLIVIAFLAVALLLAGVTAYLLHLRDQKARAEDEAIWKKKNTDIEVKIRELELRNRELEGWIPGAKIVYAIENEPEFPGRHEAEFEVLGSGLKKDGDKIVPYKILKSPFEEGPLATPLESYPDKNIRRHIRNQLRKPKKAA